VNVDDVEQIANITHAALLEVGRPDLAFLVSWSQDDDGSWYLEPLDDVADADLKLMLRAEQVALASRR